jgi:lambda family phage portal protein
VFEQLRQQLVRWLAPPPQAPRLNQRMYAMAKQSRLTVGWGTSTGSEDTELSSSLRTARARSRQLVRDAPYAKRIKVMIQNNIVGQGIGMQAQVMNSRGELHQRINDDIEAAWERWCDKDCCHTGQSLHFADFERALMGQVFEAGEIFIRKYAQRFGDSRIPFALEMIEPERIADDLQPGPADPTHGVRLGVEVDAFGAPRAYFIRTLHPGDLRATPEQTTKIERVPAELILHIRLIDRWPQTRGMPWLHAAARKLNDMDGLTEAEITAARAAACYMGFIESPAGDDQGFGTPQEDGSQQLELEPAVVERLAAGEKFTYAAPNRPNSQLDPFMRMMLREACAGTGPSYESVSRDYSQSNYSSSRLALIDDRDLWRTFQQGFIRQARKPIHCDWLQAAVLSGQIPSINLAEYAAHPEKFEAVRFKPRGWSWIDPAKEVEANKEAILAGFTTVGRVIDLNGDGSDLEDILKERKRELELMKEAGLVFSTDPSAVQIPAPPTMKTPVDQNATDAGESGDAAVSTAEKMLRNLAHRNTGVL